MISAITAGKYVNTVAAGTATTAATLFGAPKGPEPCVGVGGLGPWVFVGPGVMLAPEDSWGSLSVTVTVVVP